MQQEPEYIIVKTTDDYRTYYTRGGAWTDIQAEARRFSGSQASTLCENFNFRGVRATFIQAGAAS